MVEKKKPGVHWVWKYAFLILFEPFRGVKDKSSEIGGDDGRGGKMIFSHVEMV